MHLEYIYTINFAGDGLKREAVPIHTVHHKLQLTYTIGLLLLDLCFVFITCNLAPKEFIGD